MDIGDYFSCCINYVAADNNVISCQSCNVISQPENLIENRFFAKFLEDDANIACEDEPKEEEEKQCTNCPDLVATSWCVECEEFICQNCVMVRDSIYTSIYNNLIIQKHLFQ